MSTATEASAKARSFSGNVKLEISRQPIKAPCCIQAACYGIACFGRYFDTRGIVLHTENAFIARWAKAQYAAAGIKGRIYVKGKQDNPTYEFAVKDPFEIEKMLAAFGHTGDEIALRIHTENLECAGCFAHFAAAAFLCCGTMVDPLRGYSLEFVSSRYSLLHDFQQLLQQQGFLFTQTARKGVNVLYTKASTQIEDLLTFMGASSSSLEIMNTKVYKDIRNKVNRITNCETANIDKTVEATRQVLQAIALLEQAGLLATLPAKVQQAAALRREHPDYSLAELVQLSEVPTSKTTLSRQLSVIKQKAAELRQKQPE